MEEGETPEQGAIREIKEELGVDIEEKDIEFVAEFEYGGLTRYIFRSDYKIDVSKIILGEGEGFGFFTFEEIMKSDDFVPALKIVMERFFIR